MNNRKVTRSPSHQVTSKCWSTGALQYRSTGHYLCLCLLVSGCLLLLPQAAQAATYYVDGTNGNDKCDGKTVSTAWKTIPKANQSVYPGDTVYIRGGKYPAGPADDRCPELAGIRPGRSGQKGKPITYCNYNNEYVVFKGKTSEQYYRLPLIGISLVDRSYIIVKGLNFYDLTRHLYIANGHYNEIGYCSFEKDNTLRAWQGSWIHNNSTYNHIHHSTFSNYGNYKKKCNSCIIEIGDEWSSATNQDYPFSPDYSSYNLIEDCHLYHGGHHVMGINGLYNVVRNNYMHNEEWWVDENGEKQGYRIFYMNGSSVYSKRNLIEGNRIAYSGQTNVVGWEVEGAKIASSYNIIRRNLIYHMPAGYSFAFHQYPVLNGESKYNYMYNNTIYKTGVNYNISITLNANEPGVYNNIIKNNIIIDSSGIYNGAINTTIENNFREGNPLFISGNIPASPFDPNQPDFLLQKESPCIDTGGFLTKVTSANGSGTQFQVDDAGYFIDGWNIVEGDLIQLAGQTQTTRITNVNYDTNIITVDTPLSWSSGQGVSLAYSGSAPDIGAYEYSASSFLYGDVSGDGAISACDAALVVQDK